jgi:hypothetical protein
VRMWRRASARCFAAYPFRRACSWL